MRIVRAFSTAVVSGLMLVGAAACGEKSNSATAPDAPAATSEAGSLKPEELRVPDSEVAAGLVLIKSLADDVAAALAGDLVQAGEAQAKIEPVWASIEGSVKANDSTAYLAFEDQFAAIEGALDSKDAGKARAAADIVRKTADAYLGAHPGGAAQPAGGPSASTVPSASATPSSSLAPSSSTAPSASATPSSSLAPSSSPTP